MNNPQDAFDDAVYFWQNLPAGLTKYQHMMEMAIGLSATLDMITRRTIVSDLESIVRADKRLSVTERGTVVELTANLGVPPEHLTL